MKFITRLLSVSALGLVLGLSTMGAASAHTTDGLPTVCQSQCCQAPNWNQGPSQGNPWEGQNQCCQGGDHDPWGMSQCCVSPNTQNEFFKVIPEANCFLPPQCTFPPKHHHHHKHHKHHHHKHHHHKWGMFC